MATGCPTTYWDNVMIQHSYAELWDRVHRQTVPRDDRPFLEAVTFSYHLQQSGLAGARLLDAGCGYGRDLLYLAKQGFQVYGMDISPTAIRLAQQRFAAAGLPGRLLVGDIRAMPYPRRTFDAVISSGVMPYLLKRDILRSLAEIRRVLRPGAWLVVDFLDRDDSEHGTGPEIEPHTFLGRDGLPYHFVDRKELDELMQSFSPVRVIRQEIPAPHKVRVAWIVWAVNPRRGWF